MSTEALAAMRFTIAGGDCTVGKFHLLENIPGIRHAVSTRLGPDGANVRSDHPGREANLRALAAAVGARRYVGIRQVHGNRVVEAAEAECESVEADGLITGEPGVALTCLSADCPLIMAVDPVGGAIGVAHASWRGTVKGIAGELVTAMQRRYGADPACMQAAICPSAGPCCYEVGEDVVEAATASFGDDGRVFLVRRDGRVHFDLWAANVAQLTRMGLGSHNIAVAEICTICDGRFYSVRREGPATGRFACLLARG